ncbi:CETN3 [Scenedesmus sp. PABB004]|nr:CETN3 [Scenedesmus sp. PABB004]
MEQQHMTSPLFMRMQQRIARSSLPRKLTEEEQAEIAYAFEKLGGGEATVNAQHVKVALRAMGFPVKKADVAELLRDHGLPGDAPLAWPAFSELLAAKVSERSPHDEVRRAFTLFDVRGAGRITLEDLGAIARQLRCDIEPEELRDMIAEFDRDGDGAISEEEFRAIVAAHDE